MLETTAPAEAPSKPAATTRERPSLIYWLERKSQPWIVAGMATVAVVRGFYLFTDKLVALNHYPALNAFLSLVTGIMLSLASELTITIAGRRHKLYKAQLFNARMEYAKASRRTKEIWEVEVERLRDQVRANGTAMRISLGMSLIAAASYLIDSTGAVGFFGFGVASALAGYVLYLMYYHGVQTDEIKPDTQAETEEIIKAHLSDVRVTAMEHLKSSMRSGQVSLADSLLLVASGLSAPAQRQLMAPLRLLVRAEPQEEETDSTTDWLTTRDIAYRLEPEAMESGGRNADDVMRKYRRRLSGNAHRCPEGIRLDETRGWIIEPEQAELMFKFPPVGLLPGAVVEADRR